MRRTQKTKRRAYRLQFHRVEGEFGQGVPPQQQCECTVNLVGGCINKKRRRQSSLLKATRIFAAGPSNNATRLGSETTKTHTHRMRSATPGQPLRVLAFSSIESGEKGHSGGREAANSLE